MYHRNFPSWLKHFDFILLDLLCLHLAFIGSYLYWVRIEFPYAAPVYGSMALVLSMVPMIQAASESSHRSRRTERLPAERRQTRTSSEKRPLRSSGTAAERRPSGLPAGRISAETRRSGRTASGLRTGHSKAGRLPAERSSGRL